MQLFKLNSKKDLISTQVKIPKAQSFLKASSNNVLTLFVLASLGLQGLLFLQTTFNTIWIAKLANKPAPTLVELLDGRSIRVEAIGSNERTPKAIQNFTSEIITMLFSTTGDFNSDINTPTSKNKSKPKQDLGVILQGKSFRYDSKVTTAAWSASFALSEDFRSAFLKELADITPDSIFTGSTQTILSITHLSEPERIEDGKWKMNMIANLYTFQLGDRIGQVIPINKIIYLKAVYIVPEVLKENATALQKMIYRVRSAGLEIYRFGDLTAPSSQQAP